MTSRPTPRHGAIVSTTKHEVKQVKKPASSAAKKSAASATSAKRAAAKNAAAKKATAKKAARGTADAGSAKKHATPAARSSTKQKMAPPALALEKLREMHPDAHCELDHVGPFQLLVATVLSAQTTDVNVNKATPKLFERFPDARSLAQADPTDVEPYVSTLGFFRQKAKSIVGLSKKLVEEFGGEVPRRLDDLVKLPGVGRKTANVVLGVIWNTPEGVVVDTHVQRISQRLGWTKNTDPVKIEQDLMHLIPRNEWDMTSHLLIFHGRRVCFARKPNCEGCALNTICPSAFDAEHVGRKPKRDRSA
ncbi:MAG: endonuclease III [Myxococcales bacterium 68-20]|nr:MAG: endonuclease III [Myxococcales bacterium 68-20]